MTNTQKALAQDKSLTNAVNLLKTKIALLSDAILSERNEYAEYRLRRAMYRLLRARGIKSHMIYHTSRKLDIDFVQDAIIRDSLASKFRNNVFAHIACARVDIVRHAARTTAASKATALQSVCL